MKYLWAYQDRRQIGLPFVQNPSSSSRSARRTVARSEELLGRRCSRHLTVILGCQPDGLFCHCLSFGWYDPADETGTFMTFVYDFANMLLAAVFFAFLGSGTVASIALFAIYFAAAGQRQLLL